MLKHTWAIPLRDAIAEAGGYRIDDGYISPLELVTLGVALGMVSAEDPRGCTTSRAHRRRHPERRWVHVRIS